VTSWLKKKRNAMNNTDTPLHTTGTSIFLDDIREPEGLLHAAVYVSPAAHGKIRKMEVSRALAVTGVLDVLTADDITGENQIGGIIRDESLLAEDHVAFIGEPMALVVAESRDIARRALKEISVDIEPLPVITDPRAAYEKGELIAPPRTFVLGDVDAAWDGCDVVVEGRVQSGGQEHFYLETQGALVVPVEGGGLKIYSSTQSPTGVQRIAARVLGIPMHQIEVDVRRLGGAFGGKEDQATPWAVLAALAARKLKAPVKLLLDRAEDMKFTGKRHPYSSDFKIGLKNDGTIQAYEVMFYQNSGAVADLSTAILERTLFHTTNSYYIPNVKATAAACRTNLPPFTAFRGFGGPQAMLVMEAAIAEAAEALKVLPAKIQEANLLKEKDTFPYGMQVEHCRAERCWQEATERYEIADRFGKVEAFNASHDMIKKGISAMPVCFGISFTNTGMNQAGALVHVYTDGSVGVSTGAVEMGQGVNMKIRRITADTFSLPPERVKVETSNTTRVANTSPTAASSGADMNGKAAQIAARQILERLRTLAAELLNHPEPGDIQIHHERVSIDEIETGLTWEQLINEAYWRRINLSAQGYYATPGLYFDRKEEKGKPFAYHVFGTAITEVTVDVMRGTYEIEAVRVVHDGGRSLDEKIDRGQAEGGTIQGIGWVTMEELLYGDDGRLLTENTSTYKVPDIKFTPLEMETYFLEDVDNPYAVMSSKAIGEPPFMYGIGAYFAIRSAVKSIRPDATIPYDSPITPEKVFRYIYG
jgi:xanthine dehydrogenase large subunit